MSVLRPVGQARADSAGGRGHARLRAALDGARLFYLSDEHAARVSLSGPQAPRAFDGLDPGRAGRDLLPNLPETGEVVNRMTTSWCVVPGPTRSWAEVVYPTLGGEEAPEKLWEAVDTSAARGRRSGGGVAGTHSDVEGQRQPTNRPPIRCATSPWAWHRPHRRLAAFGTLGRRRSRHRRWSTALSEPSHRGALHHP